MATFPAVIPSSRTFTPGSYPATSHTSYLGKESRTRISNTMASSQLRLGFSRLNESDLLLLLAHYSTQAGEFSSFDISSDLLSGVSSASDYTLGGYSWRYAEPPFVTDLPCGTSDIEITLESVPNEGALANGLNVRKTASIFGFSAGSSDGLQSELSASITGGTASTYLASGYFLSSAVSISTSGASAFPDGIHATLLATITSESASVFPDGDPSIGDVALLLPFDAANGQSDFIDYGRNSLSITAFGGASADASIKKYGISSLSLDGADGYLTIPDNPDWDFGTGDFTVEAWIYMKSLDTTMPIIGRLSPSAGGVAWGLRVLRNPTRLAFYSGASSMFRDWTDGTLNQWHHIAVTRASSELSLYANGSRLGSTLSNSTNLGASTSVVYVGTNSLLAEYFHGLVDDVRITTGVARYADSTYEVPTRALPLY